MTYKEKQAYDLRCRAEAVERQDELVTVELSVPVLWVIRDLIGIFGLGAGSGVPVHADMVRINAALPEARPVPGTPHVSGWAHEVAAAATAKGGTA